MTKLSPHSTSSYRPDIDGLRAIAVLAVLGYHAFPRYMSGGFIGVDIFFVISGFLIAKIIFQEMIDGHFTIRGFYARRIKRIFPALILVTLTSFMMGWYILAPNDFHSLGSNIAGGSLFLNNFVLLNQVGYFDLAAEKKPLLHLWSLGIEEQYYIIFPLLLLGIRRWRFNAVTLTCVLALISFLTCSIFIRKHAPSLAFYLPFTRSWELLLGAAMAIWIVNGRENTLPNWATHAFKVLRFKLSWLSKIQLSQTIRHNIYALIAVGLIAYALVHYNPHTKYPGHNTLVPVIAAMLLILSSSAWFNKKFLSCRTMVFIGLISYPLYLWHYPLMAYARIISPDAVPRLFMICLVLLSILLAGLTYFLVERPIRFSKNRPYKIALLVLAMSALGVLGYLTERTNGFDIRVPQSLRPFMLTGAETSAHWRHGHCLLTPDQGYTNFSSECKGDGKHPLLLIWGDSYAAAFYAGLNNQRSTHNFSIAQYTASACPPLIGFVHPERSFCKPINDYVLKQVQILHPDTVILHSTWKYSPKLIDDGLEKTVIALRELKIPHIILLGPVPTWKGNGLSDNAWAYYHENGRHTLIPIRTKYRQDSEWDVNSEIEMRDRAKKLGIEYVSVMKVMCDKDGCLARTGKDSEELTAFDNGHMTLAGASLVSKTILPKLLNSGKSSSTAAYLKEIK